MSPFNEKLFPAVVSVVLAAALALLILPIAVRCRRDLSRW
jgi:hypothetical protein